MKISKIKHEHGIFKWIFPFQSWSQFTSFAFFEAVGFLFVVMLLKLDPKVPIWVYISALVGGTIPLFAVLPTSFELLENEMTIYRFSSQIDRSLNALGYFAFIPSNGNHYYRTRLPNWLRWKENEISIKYLENNLIVKGPMFALKILRKKLNESEKQE